MIELMMFESGSAELYSIYILIMLSFAAFFGSFCDRYIASMEKVGGDQQIDKVKSKSWIDALAVQQAGILCARTGSRDFDWIRSQVYSWWRCFD